MICLFRSSLLALSLIALSGCSALNYFEDALEDAGWAQFDRSGRSDRKGRVGLTAHRRDGSWCLGGGAIVEGGRILTIAHVVDGATEIEVELAGRFLTVPAHVERRIKAFPEDLVELRLEKSQGLFGFEGLESDETLEIGVGEPSELWTARGLFRTPCASLPGDSGSPLLDPQGRVVGIHVGTLGGSLVWTPIPVRERPVRPGMRIEAYALPRKDPCRLGTQGGSAQAAEHKTRRRSNSIRRRA